MNDLTKVLFTQVFKVDGRVYNAGEEASFKPKMAERILATGKAERKGTGTSERAIRNAKRGAKDKQSAGEPQKPANKQSDGGAQKPALTKK